jgi:RHS repeat-associated protein
MPMNNTTVTKCLLCALGFWLLFQQSGQCFYDPSCQRWINRDPYVDLGFKRTLRRLAPKPNEQQLYSYAYNTPLNNSDPLGLTIWVVTRPTDPGWIPPFGLGTHAYLWDDRSPLAPGNHSCGLESPYHAYWPGHGPTSTPGDTGPVGKVDAPIPGWTDINGITAWPVEGSEGHEDEIMSHCKECVNKTYGFVPGYFDCHSRCDTMLKDMGFRPPPHPRLKPGEEWLLGPGWLGFP